MNCFADSFTVTVVVGTPIVPAIFGCFLLCKPYSTRITEELTLSTGVLMKIEFEFRTECPLAVAAGIGHTFTFSVLS